MVDGHIFCMTCDLCTECRIRRLSYGDHHIKSIEDVFATLPLCNCQGKGAI